MEQRVQVLDCTLRDGGLALEDAIKNGNPAGVFGSAVIRDIFHNLIQSDMDIIEIGSIETTQDDHRDISIYQTLEDVSRLLPEKSGRRQMYAALYRGPDCPVETIPEWNDSLCKVVRVIIRYSELEKSLDFCKRIAQKNYHITIQPMVTMRYTARELQRLCDAANDMGAYALYFVDSYGYMRDQDVLHYFNLFDSQLDPSIRIGFHAHNNLNLAFANALTFIGQHSERRLIVDSCLLGMGQGAGNLQTELIAAYLNRHFGAAYNYDAVLEGCEAVEKLWTNNLWGYSVTYLLPAIHQTAYKFSIALRNRYHLSFAQIHQILARIPEDLRHRYTSENTKKLLRLCGYGDIADRGYDE
jgi:4-hydroxy 2-oxovalerate aldolase